MVPTTHKSTGGSRGVPIAKSRRVHPRIQVTADIEVKPNGSLQWFSAQLQEISRGGVRFVIKEYIGVRGDVIELLLPSIDKERLNMEGTISRVQLQDQGHLLLAVRFKPHSIDQQAALDRIFVILLGRGGGGQRAHVRVAYRMEVRYGDNAELQGILQDVSQGGCLMLATRDAPSVNDSVRVVIPTPDDTELRLKARVVRDQRVSTESGRGTLVGLQFENMSADKEVHIQALINSTLFPNSASA
ncbi:MAG: PilZ domain-containing protein [Gammaproteobacteria bacterium]|nr:PilZ domain-containing protein [Gammaproteobacteria bacterium]